MKAKYEMGEVVEFVEEGATAFGRISSVITDAEGVYYRVNGQQIDERAIVQSYRPKQTRTRKPKAVSADDMAAAV